MKALSSETQCCLSVPHEETSQSDFDISWDLTEKIQGTQQGHKMSHNVGTRLLSGLLVIFASGVVEWNCWMKQQSNAQKQGALMAIQTGCLAALHGSQSLTALNR